MVVLDVKQVCYCCQCRNANVVDVTLIILFGHQRSVSDISNCMKYCLHTANQDCLAVVQGRPCCHD